MFSSYRATRYNSVASNRYTYFFQLQQKKKKKTGLFQNNNIFYTYCFSSNLTYKFSRYQSIFNQNNLLKGGSSCCFSFRVTQVFGVSTNLSWFVERRACVAVAFYLDFAYSGHIERSITDIPLFAKIKNVSTSNVSGKFSPPSTLPYFVVVFLGLEPLTTMTSHRGSELVCNISSLLSKLQNTFIKCLSCLNTRCKVLISTE